MVILTGLIANTETYIKKLMFRLGRLDGVVTKGPVEGDESNEDGPGKRSVNGFSEDKTESKEGRETQSCGPENKAAAHVGGRGTRG